MKTQSYEVTQDGGVPIKSWTKGVAFEDPRCTPWYWRNYWKRGANHWRGNPCCSWCGYWLRNDGGKNQYDLATLA